MVSQFITVRGCIIQGVLKSEDEIRNIYCPEHQEKERVYSFKRKIDLMKPLSEIQKNSIHRLKMEYDKIEE